MKPGKVKLSVIEGCYNTIDYKDEFNNIRALADLEWNGKITLEN